MGDWTTRIWNEDLKSSLITTSYATTAIRGGSWSPTRPSVFYTIKADGNLDVWDLCYKSTAPTLTVRGSLWQNEGLKAQVNVKNVALTSFAMHENGSLCGIGSSEGDTTLLELSQNFVQPVSNEKQVRKAFLSYFWDFLLQSLAALFERETLKEKNLEKIHREMKIRARKEANKKDDILDVEERSLEQLEDQFRSLTNMKS